MAGGGASEALPLQKYVDNVLAMSKRGGGTTSFEVVLTRELEDLAIVMGEGKKFPSFKTGLGGGGAKV